jgi:hypothetical protein
MKHIEDKAQDAKDLENIKRQKAEQGVLKENRVKWIPASEKASPAPGAGNNVHD